MAEQLVIPADVMADNQRTVDFLVKRARSRGHMKKVDEIKKWGAERQVRVDKLRRFTGLLEDNGIIDSSRRATERVYFELAVQHCVAIATAHGLDLEYEFIDSQSGPLSGRLTVDIKAVAPERGASCVGLFGSEAAVDRFLEAVRGKGVDELATIARPLVIEKEFRIIPLDRD